MTGGTVAGGGVAASLPTLHMCLRAQVCGRGPGAGTSARCNSAPCDMLGGALGLLIACGLCCVPQDGVGLAKWAAWLTEVQEPPGCLGTCTPCKGDSIEEEGSGVSKGQAPKCTTLSASPLDL